MTQRDHRLLTFTDPEGLQIRHATIDSAERHRLADRGPKVLKPLNSADRPTVGDFEALALYQLAEWACRAPHSHFPRVEAEDCTAWLPAAWQRWSAGG